MKVEYSSNNSGGNWWLKDADWLALEAAGWVVEWKRDDQARALARVAELRAEGKDEEAARQERWATAVGADKEGRWLGALATKAEKAFASPSDAIREFERVTGQSASDEGCNCCGAPHSFHWTNDDGSYGGHASGDDVIALLYENAPSTLREAAERLSGGAK